MKASDFQVFSKRGRCGGVSNPAVRVRLYTTPTGVEKGLLQLNASALRLLPMSSCELLTGEGNMRAVRPGGYAKVSEYGLVSAITFIRETCPHGDAWYELTIVDDSMLVFDVGKPLPSIAKK